ncbi:TIGR02594 family protein [Eleftheria terrae]|uniref:NlpC/P60 family protein n=1 Tax=Eleftheria terrae TaxID=1597781 RepID=UPI00263B02BA|nr:TIGR02594 family protein [Eleftheria terrae]WKB52254.1 TIGR02594 family protein [Eleftheria terrae]
MKITRINDTGPDVTQLQLLLNGALPFRPALKVDGHFGLRTQQAVVAYQRLKGLDPDGRVGPLTRTALGLRAVQAPPSMRSVLADSSPYLRVAVAEVGVRQQQEAGLHNPRILEYHKTTSYKAADDETAWCSSFVNWVVQQAGSHGTGSAAAKSWLNWGTSVPEPVAGDIVVLKKKTSGHSQATGSTSGYHVGFFLSKTATHVHVLGGNQSRRVKESSFPLSDYEVKGYRR